MTLKQSDSEQQAQRQLESISLLLETSRNAMDDDGKESAYDAIREYALSVEVASAWRAVGEDEQKPDQYRIVLCYGGPAVQIVGTLNQYMEPTAARLEHQDWGTQWEVYRLDEEQEATLLAFAGCFYFGE